MAGGTGLSSAVTRLSEAFEPRIGNAKHRTGPCPRSPPTATSRLAPVQFSSLAATIAGKKAVATREGPGTLRETGYCVPGSCRPPPPDRPRPSFPTTAFPLEMDEHGLSPRSLMRHGRTGRVAVEGRGLIGAGEDRQSYRAVNPTAPLRPFARTSRRDQRPCSRRASRPRWPFSAARGPFCSPAKQDAALRR